MCASGMKAVMLAAQSIQLGLCHVVVAGGMESMTNVPHYLPRVRAGLRLGHSEVVDGLIKDGEGQGAAGCVCGGVDEDAGFVS